ncbi:MAG TPA: hypothetical protein VGO78_07920, partial [Acidimicrobiales bacterium]|nr:hypothetical protein [Acidimicrobiales bacterium]
MRDAPGVDGPAVAAGLLEQVGGLVDDLRRAGVATGLTSVVEGCTALGHVDVGQREQVRLALRCTLVKRVEDEPVFDALFATRFALRRAPAAAPADAGGEHDLFDRIVHALAAGDDLRLAELADEAAERHAGSGPAADGRDRYRLQRTLRALRPHTLAPDALRLRRGEVPRRDEATERADRADVGVRLDRFLLALAAATRRRPPPPGESDDDGPYARV